MVAPKAESAPRRQPLLARRSTWGFLMITPWLAGFVIFTAGPMIISLVLSLFSYDLARSEFVGLGNFGHMFGWERVGGDLTATDPRFVRSLFNTSVYVAVSVPLGLTGSLLVAVLLNQRVRGIAAYRTLFYLPTLVPAVAAALLWMWVFQPEHGILNVILEDWLHAGWFFRLLHLPYPPEWLQSTTYALAAFMIMGLWAIGGARMLIFLAGLQGIPDEFYEAARIDGAGIWSQFRHITLPLLTPAIFFNLVLGVIGSFQVFTAAYVMTGGRPADATLFYVLNIYQTAFERRLFGHASALAWVLFAILFPVTLLQVKLSRRWVHYEGAAE
jgi:multiple sugar transport system permease protein